MAHTSGLVTSPPPVVEDENSKLILQWILAEFLNIARVLEIFTHIEFEPQHREPERPRQGLVVFADGTNWDPGSGEGLYVYKAAGWTLIA